MNPESIQNTPSATPVLSVGLPVYNGAKWIVDAIESILEQSFTDFELIISDNASNDATETICRGFAQQDPRVKYHRNDINIGIYRNFNLVFELSSGKYFKWAADSDFCLDGFFAKCVAVLDARPDVVLTYPQAYFLTFDIFGNEVTSEYFDDLNLEDERPSERFIKYLNREKVNNVMHGLIRVSALHKTSLIRPIWGSDITMVAELALLGKFVEVSDRLFVRRFDAETSSVLMSKATAIKRKAPLGTNLKQKLNLHSHRYLIAMRAPINGYEKWRVYLYLMRRNISLYRPIVRKIINKMILGKRSF